jgi:surface antigen/peptidoglycan hydrolase CwlO-like protein
MKHGGGFKQLFLRFVLGLAVVVLFSPILASASTLTDLLNQQANLQQKALESKKAIDKGKKDVANLQDVLDGLDTSISGTQSRIDNTQGQINITSQVISQLADSVSQTQDQLKQLETKLRAAYVSLYEMSVTSNAVSGQGQSLSDTVTSAQYVQSIQDQLQKSAAVMNTALQDLNTKKAENEKQKADLESLKTQLSNDQSSLNGQRSQKDRLLKAKQSDITTNQDILNKLKSQQETLDSQIYQLRRAQGSGETITGGTGGYPWADEPDVYAVDPFLFYKRQCTSFVAWYFGFYNTRPGQGDAANWPALAGDQGMATGSTPRANSILVLPRGTNMPYGHVAVVRSVNSDGTVNLWEYNWVVERGFDERDNVSPSRYGIPAYIYP